MHGQFLEPSSPSLGPFFLLVPVDSLCSIYCKLLYQRNMAIPCGRSTTQGICKCEFQMSYANAMFGSNKSIKQAIICSFQFIQCSAKNIQKNAIFIIKRRPQLMDSQQQQLGFTGNNQHNYLNAFYSTNIDTPYGVSSNA